MEKNNNNKKKKNQKTILFHLVKAAELTPLRQ